MSDFPKGLAIQLERNIEKIQSKLMDSPPDSIFPLFKTVTENDLEPSFVGTGFFITRSGLAITATHVLEEAMEFIPPDPVLAETEITSRQFNDLLIHQSLSPSRIARRPLMRHFTPGEDTTHLCDISLLIPSMSVDGKEWPPVKDTFSLTDTIPLRGTPIFSFHLGKHELEQKNDGTFEHLWSHFRRGQFLFADQERAKKARPYCKVDLEIPPGASGAPVFDGFGRIWGICSQSLQGEESTSWVTPINEILNFKFPLNQDGSGDKVSVRDFADQGYLRIQSP